MSPRPISQVHSGRQPAGYGHPADRAPPCLSAACPAAEFGPQASLDEGPERLAEFRRPLLGGDERVVRQVNGGLHVGKRIPVVMARPFVIRASAPLRGK